MDNQELDKDTIIASSRSDSEEGRRRSKKSKKEKSHSKQHNI
jgi:hypothetical protein